MQLDFFYIFFSYWAYAQKQGALKSQILNDKPAKQPGFSPRRTAVMCAVRTYNLHQKLDYKTVIPTRGQM